MLAHALGIPRYSALGLRVALEQFAVDYVPEGAFTELPYWLIARAAGWEDAPEVFITALQECGIFDENLCMTDEPLPDTKVKLVPVVAAKVPKPAESALPKVPDAPRVKSSSEEIAQRLENDPEMRAFFADAEKIIGTMGVPAMSSLISDHDYYGLPWDVLLVLLHSVTALEGKTGIKTYESYAKKLYNAGASSAEDAERFFTAYRDVPKLFTFLSVKWQLSNSKPTPSQREKLERWISWNFSEEMIDIAYQTALDKPAKMPFSFADKVLQDWHENGISTPEDVRRSRAEWAARLKYKAKVDVPKKGGASNSQSAPSYDLDKAVALSRRGRRKLPQKKD